MNGNGKLPHNQNKQPMEPLPQKGYYPLEKLCYWFEKDLEQLLDALKELGVPVEESGLVDMGKVIAAIERRHRNTHDEDGHKEE